MTFTGTLLPYQPEAVDRMCDRNKMLVAYDLGLGKTVLTIAAIGPANHFPDYNYLEDEFDKTVMVSGLKSKNVKQLLTDIFELLPTKINRGVKEEIESMSGELRPLTSMGSREYIGEIIREKAYLFLREEIPYTINVKVKEVVDKNKLIYIKAEIITSADRYKKMIIGVGGKKIREIGQNARKELELMSTRKVFLDLTVMVDTHWMEGE